MKSKGWAGNLISNSVAISQPSNPECYVRPFIKTFIITKSFCKCFAPEERFRWQSRNGASVQFTRNKHCIVTERREIGKGTDVFYWNIRFCRMYYIRKGSIGRRMNGRAKFPLFKPWMHLIQVDSELQLLKNIEGSDVEKTHVIVRLISVCVSK